MRSARFVLAFCLTGWVGGTSQAADPPSAGEILAAIKAIPQPRIAGRDRDDPTRLAAYRTAVHAAQERKADLIGALIRVDPANPEVAKLAPVRWRTNSGTPDRDASTRAEIAAILARGTPPSLVVEAAYFQTWDAMSHLGDHPTAAAMLPLAEAFAQRFPADERCAGLLQRAAALLPDSPAKTALLERAERDYATTPDARQAAARQAQRARVGQPFDLEFRDASTGATVAVKQLRGQVVVIDFWATWCGPCVAAMPRLKELYAEYHPQGVEFIGVSLDEPKETGGLDKLRAFVAERQIPWPQFYQGNGWESAFSSGWDVHSLPTLFLIDATGNLASVDAEGNLETLLPVYLKKARQPR